MGRSPRIEFQGAVYHVMSRGNRQESIFPADADNRIFLDTLRDACERTGWRVHAFVLMGNHYHLLIETIEANLVDGMRWLQGTYTKRFNRRHNQCGHLFQSRYKALLVDPEGDYFQTVSAYIHLNPARAKCFDLENGKLTDYLWSSYPLYVSPTERPEWLCVERTLGNLGLTDNRSGHESYRQYMQKRVLEIYDNETPWAADKRWEKIRTGWCFGGDEFRDQMIRVLGEVLEGKRRDSFVGEETKRHDGLAAEQWMEAGLDTLKLGSADLATLKKSDPRKMAVAWLIRRNTSVRNEWISNRLKMGGASKLSSFVKQVEDAEAGVLFALKKRLKDRTDTP